MRTIEYHEIVEVWNARCVLCGHIVCEKSDEDVAQSHLDLHLMLAHGIEVEA